MHAVSPLGRPFEALLNTWLSSCSIGGIDDQVPFPVRLALNQLLDLADETELRAHTIGWMNDSLPLGNPSHQKARSLLQIATELRRTAERLFMEVGLEPIASPSLR
jgi:hypothetical protein